MRKQVTSLIPVYPCFGDCFVAQHFCLKQDSYVVFLFNGLLRFINRFEQEAFVLENKWIWIENSVNRDYKENNMDIFESEMK